MAYNETLADRVRELIADQKKVEEKKMMGGLTFMVNKKMCVGVYKDDLMVRIDPDTREQVLEKTGCRQMDFTGKPMKGFVFVDASGTSKNSDLKSWISFALEYNKKAKASKKRTAKKKKF
jgi:TfoX/Sxy family transcriptional regulator of competence genes